MPLVVQPNPPRHRSAARGQAGSFQYCRIRRERCRNLAALSPDSSLVSRTVQAEPACVLEDRQCQDAAFGAVPLCDIWRMAVPAWSSGRHLIHPSRLPGVGLSHASSTPAAGAVLAVARDLVALAHTVLLRQTVGAI